MPRRPRRRRRPRRPRRPRQVTYTVTGTKAPGDIISVTYVDASGSAHPAKRLHPVVVDGDADFAVGGRLGAGVQPVPGQQTELFHNDERRDRAVIESEQRRADELLMAPQTGAESPPNRQNTKRRRRRSAGYGGPHPGRRVWCDLVGLVGRLGHCDGRAGPTRQAAIAGGGERHSSWLLYSVIVDLRAGDHRGVPLLFVPGAMRWPNPVTRDRASASCRSLLREPRCRREGARLRGGPLRRAPSDVVRAAPVVLRPRYWNGCGCAEPCRCWRRWAWH